MAKIVRIFIKMLKSGNTENHKTENFPDNIEKLFGDFVLLNTLKKSRWAKI